MKRITRIQLFNHPVLKDTEFHLIDKGEVFSEHYFSLLIGQNGTGKSKLLEAISIILFYIKRKEVNPKLKPDFNFGFEIEFKVSKKTIVAKQLSDSIELTLSEKITLNELLPSNVVISAYTFNDKFPKYEEDEFLKYCGLRTVTNNIFVNRPAEDCFNNLIEIIKVQNKLKAVSPIFEELGLKKTILVRYNSGIQKNILENKKVVSLLEEIKTAETVKGNLIDEFKKVIIDTTGIESRKRRDRFQDTSIRRFISNDEIIISTLKYLSQNEILTPTKRGSTIEQVFKFHWSDNNELTSEEKEDNRLFNEHLDVFKHLKEIEIIKFGGFQVKREGYYDFDQASSGEFHFLHLTSSILRYIESNSLVLIDEPEISLHPNWQNKLLFSLNPIFKLFPNSQFICASHSHLMVSSLEQKTSSIITLKRDNGNLVVKNLDRLDTYGWSAEQILFDVFEMATDRNYYLSLKVQEIVHLMSQTTPDVLKIESLKRELKELKIDNLDRNDPFNLLLKSLLK